MALGLGSMKNAFGMLKQYNDMQKKMKSTVVDGVSKDSKVKVTMDGTNTVQSILIDDSLMSVDMKDVLVKDMKEAMENAKNAVQQALASSMDIEQIKGMLGSLG